MAMFVAELPSFATRTLARARAGAKFTVAGVPLTVVDGCIEQEGVRGLKSWRLTGEMASEHAGDYARGNRLMAATMADSAPRPIVVGKSRGRAIVTTAQLESRPSGVRFVFALVGTGPAPAARTRFWVRR